MQIGNWKSGSQVATTDFTFANTTNATKIDLKDAGNIDELPNEFRGARQ